MRKFATITKEKWAFAAVMAIACVWGTNSYAQSDADAVKAAVAAYTAAVDSLDPAKMEALWVHGDTVMDIEPGSRTIAVGWDAVKKFIDGNFLVFAELKNVLADGSHVQIRAVSERRESTADSTSSNVPNAQNNALPAATMQLDRSLL